MSRLYPENQEARPTDAFAKFTNRVNERSRFRKLVFKKKCGESLPILAFYGVSGQGKSWLLRKLRDELCLGEDGYPRNMATPLEPIVPFAHLDFDRTALNTQRVDEWIGRIRRQWHEIPCPRYDLARAALDALVGMESPAIGERSPSQTGDWAESVAAEIGGEVLDEAPFVGTFVKGMRWLAGMWKNREANRLKKIYKEWLRSHEGERVAARLSRMTAEEILPELALSLARDLAEQLPKRDDDSACRAVLFLDTMEHNRRGPRTRQQRFEEAEAWVCELWNACKSDGNSFLQVVIGSRDRPDWHEFDVAGHWNALFRNPECLETHLVGGLSERDARSFLDRWEISESDLQDAILRVSVENLNQQGERGYHTFALGLCADVVVEERSRGGIIPAPASFDLPAGKIEKLAS